MLTLGQPLEPVGDQSWGRLRGLSMYVSEAHRKSVALRRQQCYSLRTFPIQSLRGRRYREVGMKSGDRGAFVYGNQKDARIARMA